MQQATFPLIDNSGRYVSGQSVVGPTVFQYVHFTTIHDTTLLSSRLHQWNFTAGAVKGRRQVITRDDRYFVLDALLDRQPVKGL